MRLFQGKIASITHNADKSATITASVSTAGPGADKSKGGFSGTFTFTVNEASNFEQQIGGVNDMFTVTLARGIN